LKEPVTASISFKVIGGFSPLAPAQTIHGRIGRSTKPVQQFGTFTEDLEKLADWLKECGIKTVALRHRPSSKSSRNPTVVGG
jgi:hypothetical protein